MISVSQIGWSHYKGHEGPFFGGDFQQLRVPAAERDDSFARKVLAITAAAEGGSWSSINMYDGGLVSVGAMQFIDVAPRFGVVDMLGEVAERCGADAVVAALRPALDASGAMFFKTPSGKWRFSLSGVTVSTIAQQNVLYFGDAAGNATGSYTDAKRLHAKTWAACMANVWYIPGAVDVQSEYCLRRVMTDFTWGRLQTEMFSQNEEYDGWLGATKAMLLAYAVNAPAIVVKMYDSGRVNSYPQFSPEWCLELLRHVVVNGGVDVWRARWSAKVPYVEKAFGVKLPTYNQLVNRAWVAPTPPLPLPTPPVVDPQPEPTPEPTPEPQPQPTPLPPEPNPQPPVVVDPSGWSKMFELALTFVRMFMEVFARVLGKR